jgi:hypothetical protein
MLELWQVGTTAQTVLKAAMESGAFPSLSAGRLRNIVIEAFAPRFLIEGAQLARILKAVQGRIATADCRHLLLIYTCRPTPSGQTSYGTCTGPGTPPVKLPS